MQSWKLFDRATVIPFMLRGREGRVGVYYGANDDPVKSGFDSLNLNFDTNLCRGYPAIHACIEEYAGSGYRTVCGWIQIVTRVDFNGQGGAVTSVSLDIAPAFQDLDLPFACFGNLPQFFDAPCLNLGGSAELL